MHTTKVREAWQRSKRFKNVFISEASKVTIGAGEHQSVDLSARTAAGMAVDSR